MKAYTLPSKTLPRVDGIYQDFINGCKGETVPCSNFDVSGLLSEIVLLGNLAIRTPGEILQWDGKNMEATNVPDANKFVKREYYADWTL